MLPLKSDHIKQLITLIVIKFGGFHFWKINSAGADAIKKFTPSLEIPYLGV